MSERIDGQAVAYQEKPQQCDDCGEIRELRPYGPGGACITLDRLQPVIAEQYAGTLVPTGTRSAILRFVLAHGVHDLERDLGVPTKKRRRKEG